MTLRFSVYPALVAGITVTAWLPILPDWRLALIAPALWLSRRWLPVHALPWLPPVCALLLGLAWAGWRAELRLAERLPTETEGQPQMLTVTVRDIPKTSDFGTRIRFSVDNASVANEPLPSTILLSDYKQQDWPPGSRWQIHTSLRRPLATRNPAGFDGETWYWSENIGAVGSVRKGRTPLPPATDAQARLDRLRMAVLQRIEQVGAPHPRAAALIAALTVGVQNRINQSDWQLFRASGLIHLVSISGVHVTLLAALISGLAALILRRWPTRRIPPRLIIALTGLTAATAYALLAGWSIPTQRTLYMLLAAALMLLTRRALPPFRIWWIALATVLVIDPFAVLAPGLWLSFGLVAILMAATLGRRRVPGKWLAAWQGQYAVTVASLVMLTVFFGSLPLLSPLLNIIAIPLVSVLITPLALFGTLCPWDGPLQLSIWLADLSLSMLDKIAPYAVAWPLAASPWPLWLLAGCGALWLIAPRGLPGRPTGWLLLLPLLLYQPPAPVPGSADIRLIDTGQGLSLLVRTARHSLLFDTADGDAQRLLLPQLHALGLRRLDTVIASHHDNDHDGALPSLLSAISVNRLLAGQPDTIANHHAAPCLGGTSWIWDGVRFEILAPAADNAPANDNAASCVLRIVAGRQALLVSADLPIAGEDALVEQYGAALRSDILIAGHHGSKTASGHRWLDAVAPSQVWISAGYRNRYHHPHPSVVERLEARQIQIWRTDLNGALHSVLGDGTALPTEAIRCGSQPFWRIRTSCP